MILLQRRDATANCARFYRVEVGPDLFGTWCVTREWGRIGTEGRRQILAQADPGRALATADRLVRAKTRRGYCQA